MQNNIPETKSEDLTIIAKVKKYYYNNKKFILSSIIILVFLIAFLFFYLDLKDKKRIEISDNYIKAKIYLQNGKKKEAKAILKSIIDKNDKVYSTLSLFLIFNENLGKNQKELANLFDQVLKNNNFDSEIKNLITFKKNILESSFLNESEILETTKTLINSKSLWRYHALLLLGDYFLDKKQHIKAKEFYNEIISSENAGEDLIDIAISRLVLINE